MLKASHLKKNFGSVRAVDDVSFKASEEKILGLLGPNGAGKTTTIRLVLNILRPDAGEVLYRGTLFSDDVRRQIGYLPEERGLYRKSRLLDTVLYFAELRGMTRNEARQEAQRWLERFDLLKDSNRRVEELSKGNQQKVQFIVAVIHRPALLILDEPFSGLDPVNQNLVKDVILELKREGKAVILSTHQMDHAERLCDNITLIHQGKVVLEGEIGKIKQRYGKSVVTIEFTGDAAFVNGIPGVAQALVYQNAAEISLENGLLPHQLLKLLVSRLDIRKFDLVEPPLQSIFLQMVGEPKQ
jgi:ABC-2 type transport system ATP-binding protein